MHPPQSGRDWFMAHSSVGSEATFKPAYPGKLEI